MTDEKTTHDEDIRCPHCQKKLYFYRIKTEEFICRQCGKTWEKGDETSK